MSPRSRLAPAAGLVLATAAFAACGGDDLPAGGQTPLAAQRTGGPVPGLVWAIGDGADGSAAGRRLARRAVDERPSRFLYLGDVYERGTDEEFATRYEPLYGALASRTIPTPGNHEWRTAGRGYFRYWRTKRGGRPLPPWFATRYAGWEIVSLNTETSYGAGSPQLRWLGRHLAVRRSTCRIALLHRPRFSAGSHGDQSRSRRLWDALRGDARLVLSGHDHDSQHLRAVGGLTQIVAGAGGRERYAVDATDPRLRWSDDRHFAGLRLDLSPGTARFAFVSAEGDVLHRGRVRCERPFNAPPRKR